MFSDSDGSMPAYMTKYTIRSRWTTHNRPAHPTFVCPGSNMIIRETEQVESYASLLGVQFALVLVVTAPACLQHFPHLHHDIQQASGLQSTVARKGQRAD